MPEQNEELFLSILKKFQDAGVLNEVVLIGSWCLLFYKELFKNNAAMVPAVRTVDMDLLVLRPRNVKQKVDVTKMLEEMGFEVKFHPSGYYKYIREDFTVEFLMPLYGSGDVDVEEVKSLNITVQGLRHLDYKQEELITLTYKGCRVRLPRPEIYTLKKFLIHEKRVNELKKEKDLRTAQEMSELLLSHEENKLNLKAAFEKFSKKQKKNLIRITKEKAIEVHNLFAAST